MLVLALLLAWGAVTSALRPLAGVPILGSLPGVNLPNMTSSVIDPVGNAAKSVVATGIESVSPDDVCFGYLGCFSMAAPWHSLLRPLPPPLRPEQVDTRFYLYSRSSPARWNISTQPEVSLMGSPFNGRKPTFFITHGFASNANTTWVADMKNALLEKFDGNVILVDWGKGASLLNYFQVASNTRVVAAEIARLVNHMSKNYGFHPRQLHLIGHSLGAQISSYVAKTIPGVDRLTALDPAQPAFEGFNEAVRLDRSDARFVQVVHTSARPFIPFIGLGMIAPQGHVDHYLNGGWKQPGCELPPKPNITSFFDLAKVPVEVISNYISCPHGRSYEYFTASLRQDNCTFWGHITSTVDNIVSTLTLGHAARQLFPDHECTATACSPLGIDAELYPARGSFDVATTSSPPFCVSEPTADDEMRQYRALS